MAVGINFDLGHWDQNWGTVEWLSTLGAEWVRLVLKPDRDDSRIFDYIHAHEMKILGVIARESLRGDTREGWRWAARHYSARYGHILDALQVGNEPDLVSPSSWTKSASDCSHMCAIFKDAFSIPIIGPGLASGQPSWLDNFNLDNVDAIAFHPYGKWPLDVPVKGDWGYGPLSDHLSGYGYYHEHLWVTEYGAKDIELGTRHSQYIIDMTKRLLAETDNAFLFCWSDKMDKGFGLHDEQDNRKEPLYTNYAEAIKGSEQGGINGTCSCNCKFPGSGECCLRAT